MSLLRRVEPETLDHLAADDPRAIRSRRDLQRVNLAMGTLSLLRRAIAAALGTRVPMRVAELGAGDGSLMLRLARKLGERWPGVALSLVDRQAVVSDETRVAFERVGWVVQLETADVFDWLASPRAEGHDLIVANLFLHHFEPGSLQRLLQAIARCSSALAALEPRRSALALAGSHLIGLLGCNDVTRRDAVLSVHAGFRGDELSSLWPKKGWRLEEGPAGAFSHRFVASRLETMV